MKFRIGFLIFTLLLAFSSVMARREPPPPGELREGAINPAFGDGGIVAAVRRDLRGSFIRSVAVDPASGNIYAGGFVFLQNNNNRRFAVWRFKPQGILDDAFADHGVAITDFEESSSEEINALVFDPFDKDHPKIIAGGFVTVNNQRRPAMARYDLNGELDATFGNARNGKRVLDIARRNEDISISDLVIDSQGRILVGGYSLNINNQLILFLARLLRNQGMDRSFGNSGIVVKDIAQTIGEAVDSLALGPDGTIFVGGYGMLPDVVNRLKFAIGMFTADGRAGDFMTKDPDSPASGTIDDLLLDADGKILVAGTYDSKFGLARYLSDGGPDRGFGQNGMVLTDFEGGAREWPHAIALTADQKIVAGGFIDMFVNGQQQSRLAVARYNSDGSLDETFGDQGKMITEIPGMTSEINSLAITPDNNIVAGGEMSLAGTPAGFLAQYFGTVAKAAEGGGAVAPDEGAGGGGGGGEVPGLEGPQEGQAGGGGGGCSLILR